MTIQLLSVLCVDGLENSQHRFRSRGSEGHDRPSKVDNCELRAKIEADTSKITREVTEEFNAVNRSLSTCAGIYGIRTKLTILRYDDLPLCFRSSTYDQLRRKAKTKGIEEQWLKCTNSGGCRPNEAEIKISTATTQTKPMQSKLCPYPLRMRSFDEPCPPHRSHLTNTRPLK
ncbi:hypothetical protein NECAME_07566 [Necator americanus]|uniref:Uncharacterized protein n=1 Tax=Necator americanus TaxID=51031 RepID=W2TM08_NECAM|nr:hypothetical protein NECAME_07566 [Necator americanus]ETN83150.1 hypothetical protein NECAME_07566 [Necator americanus]